MITISGFVLSKFMFAFPSHCYDFHEKIRKKETKRFFPN